MLEYPLLRLLIGRLVLGLVLLIAASMLIYAGVELLPGDFAQTYLGREATAESVAALRIELGFDRPLLMRYFEWLGGILQGDFGTSWSNKNSVGEQLWKRLGNSLWLAGLSALVSVPLALTLGGLAVLCRDRLADKAVSILSLAMVSLPEFFVGYLLIQFFAVDLGLAAFPAIVYDSMSWDERLSVLILPVITLAIAVTAHMMRMTRAALLNIMSSSYIETAQLKGLSLIRVIAHHAAPNAIAPIVTVIALNLAALIVGVVVIEVVFVYPGIGQYMVDAVTVRDMPVVQGCGLVFAALYILLNLGADMISILANPRLRYSR